MPARLSLALMAVTIATAIADPANAATGTTTGTTTSTSTPTTTTSTTAATTKPAPNEGRYVAAFTDWAGSSANAQSLMDGLHSGSPITLSDGTTSGSATFTPATGPMNVRQSSIALAMAQRELALQGITDPTPAEIQAALNGGSITVTTKNPATGTTTTKTVQMSGILTMRASGMGWGQIANTLGFKLGPVMSGLNHSMHAATATSTTSSSSTTSGTAGAPLRVSHSYGHGIVSGTGAPLSNDYAAETPHGNSGNAQASAGGNASGGISTGLGGGMGNGAANAHGANAGGNGGGHGKP